MNLLLDTTVLIDTLRSRNTRRALLTDLVLQGHTLGISAINIAEVYAGMRTSEAEQTDIFLARLQCFPITGHTARIAGALKNRHAREGKTFSLPDMMIAATAMEHGLVLMTDNVRDFPHHELKLFPLPDKK